MCCNKEMITNTRYPDHNQLVKENRSSGFPTWSDINWAVQPQKMTKRFKFRIKKKEELYYLCRENKGADQLCGNRESDLSLCFCIFNKPVFSQCSSFVFIAISNSFISS